MRTRLHCEANRTLTAISVNVWQTRSLKMSTPFCTKAQSLRMMKAYTVSHMMTEIGKVTLPKSSCPLSKNGLSKQVKSMPVRIYKLARPSRSCCFTWIHSSARQLCEELSLFSQASTHKVSHSSSAITSCQHRQISPPNSNNVSTHSSIRSSTCARDSLQNRMRYSSSVSSQLPSRNCYSCMAHDNASDGRPGARVT